MDTAQDSAPVLGLTRKEIFVIIKKNLNNKSVLIYKDIEKFMSEKFQREFFLSEKTKCRIRKLAFQLRKKWQAVRSSETKLFKTFPEWIDVFLPLEETEEQHDLSKIGSSKIGSSPNLRLFINIF